MSKSSLVSASSCDGFSGELHFWYGTTVESEITTNEHSIIDIFNSVITVNEFINSRAKLQLIY